MNEFAISGWLLSVISPIKGDEDVEFESEGKCRDMPVKTQGF
jgi:hypothetical protein